MTAAKVRTVAYGQGREIHVSAFRDYDDRGVLLTVNVVGTAVQAKLTPEQAGELVAALRESGACVPQPDVPKSAAELPLRSIVAAKYACWMKDPRGWIATGVATAVSDADVDVHLARGADIELSDGVTVLRVGPGGA